MRNIFIGSVCVGSCKSKNYFSRTKGKNNGQDGEKTEKDIAATARQK